LTNETHRANNYFAELSKRWPHLFQSLNLNGKNGVFTISTTIQLPGKPQVGFQTFSLLDRGPTFSFPRRLSVVDEEIDQHGFDLDEVFREALALYMGAFPGAPHRKVKKIGVVRNVTLQSGKIDCTHWLAYRLLDFGNAELKGANCFLAYVDGEFNVRLNLNPVQMQLATIISGVEQIIEPQQQFGIQVILDVNNKDMAEDSLTELEMENVLRRANEAFPDELMRFLNQRSL
jgi:hypothetical protein